MDRSEHYRWLHEDPSYRLRLEAADIRYTQTLKDEAVRRAHDGVRKLVLWWRRLMKTSTTTR